MSTAPSVPSPPRFHPWLWSFTALTMCLTAAIWLHVAPDALEPVRLGLVWVGLVTAGAAVFWHFRAEPVGRSARTPRLALTALALPFALMALGATGVLIASWCDDFVFGMRPGVALIFWVFVAPMSAVAAWQCLRQSGQRPEVERSHEIAWSLVLASLTAFFARLAVASDARDFADNWHTMEHFLLVLGLAALVAAPLTVVDYGTRRAVVSGLILFHLFGLASAVLGHPPAPWIVNQIWTRIYRPYLQFMYLNNAYHFYSPEPGPPSYLWFRLYYLDEAGKSFAHWYKIPRLDDSGRHGHTASLEYQRVMSITENSIACESVASENPFFEKLAARRVAWTPDGAKLAPIVGAGPGQNDLLVPLNPSLSKVQQYLPPQAYIRRLLESYARHVLSKHQAEFPDRNYTHLRMYRVIHRIPPTNLYLIGLDPTDPEFYTPIYFGEYDTKGKLLNPNDPLLYWVLPILRDRQGIVDSPIRDWARRHAGDPHWMRVVKAGFPVWVDEDDQPAP